MKPGVTYAILLGAALLFCCVPTGLADDVGITKARLIQKSDSSYVLEADISRQLVWAIKGPIFPDRFQVSDLEYVTQTGLIVVQATATTSGEPLNSQDEILLPWARNGASITVQWLDGSVGQGLFMRSLEGIHVPMHLLLPRTRSLGEVALEHFTLGLGHLRFRWIHLLLVALLVLSLPSAQAFKALLYNTFGQGLSLLPADLGVPGPDLLFADILGVALMLMLSYAAIRRKPPGPYLPVLFLFGLLHGMAYAQEITLLELPLDQRLPALFIFNLALDAGQFGLALILVLITKFVKLPRSKTIFAYIAGGISVALILVLFQQHVAAGRTDLLGFASAQMATQYSLPISQKPQSGAKRPQGARRLTNPVMCYLTVEPYEVRQEILIQARAAVQLLGVDDRGKGSIPLGSLEPVKTGILEVVMSANPLSIDGQPAEPVVERADFVTLGLTGVMVRQSPVVESLDNGIIGLVLVYETPTGVFSRRLLEKLKQRPQIRSEGPPQYSRRMRTSCAGRAGSAGIVCRSLRKSPWRSPGCPSSRSCCF
jgi:hypothetical protein